jgi:hypothetical protein
MIWHSSAAARFPLTMARLRSRTLLVGQALDAGSAALSRCTVVKTSVQLRRLSPSAIQYALAGMSHRQNSASCATEADCPATTPRCIQIVSSGLKVPLCTIPLPDGYYCDVDGECGGGNGAVKRKCETYTASKCNQFAKETGKCCVAIMDGSGSRGSSGSGSSTDSPSIASTTGTPSIGKTTGISGAGNTPSESSSGSTTRSSGNDGTTGGSGDKSSTSLIAGAGLFDV